MFRVALAAALVALPLRSAAAPAADWKQHRKQGQEHYEVAEQLRGRGDPAALAAFADAARAFATAAAAVPEGQRDRLSTAEALYRQSLRATELAQRDLAPDAACSEAAQQSLREGIGACEALLGLVERSLGASAHEAYTDIERMRRDFERTIEECAEPPAVDAETPPVAEVAEGPAPASAPAPAPAPSPRRGSSAGLWTSVALTGVFGAAALGTGLSRLRSPFQGAAYTSIYDAAVASAGDLDPANDIAFNKSSDMCAAARAPGADGGVVNADVVHGCDRWDALGKASIATGVLAGVSLAAAVTFLALKLRRPAKRGSYARGFTISPGLGLVLSGSF